MSLMRNAIYILFALVTAPIWLVRLMRTGKFRTNWKQRFGFGETIFPQNEATNPAAPRVLIHAVSVGEVNAARELVRQLSQSLQRPQVILATTTDTGFVRACDLFGSEHVVVRYPFDASFAVRRFLARTRPDAVVLMELELWPNFVAACRRREIPLMVVNGRLSERSFRRYRIVAPLVKSMFRALQVAAVQTEAYAERFRALGTLPDRIHVTDTMKWDTAEIADGVEGADDLAERLGIDRARPLIVAGSTAPGEHELLGRDVPRDVQLLCAPRKPEWFDQAAKALGGCVRWSLCDGRKGTGNTDLPGRFLLDTIGELRRAYALADLVIVGRTFVPLGGSDMIEPVALGKATIIGPHVDHFQVVADALLAGEGLMQTGADDLARLISELLSDSNRRCQLAKNGRAVIKRHQGATARHVELIRNVLAETSRMVRR